MQPHLAKGLPGTEAVSAQEAAALQGALAEIVLIARSYRVRVEAIALDLVRYVGERLPAHAPALQSLREINAPDLVLAWAAARRYPAALEALDRQLDRSVRSLRGGPAGATSGDDIKQAAQQLLLMGGPDGVPKLLQYTGRGPLAAWLRVVLSRIALRARRSAQKESPAAEGQLEEQAVTTADAELRFLRSRYRAPFKAAFQRALQELSREERGVLRLHFAEGLSHREIARVLDVHQTTITRRIAQAQAALQARLRPILAAELRVSPRELASLIRAIRSGLELSLGSLIPSEGDP